MKIISIIFISLLQIVLLTACDGRSDGRSDGQSLVTANKLVQKPVEKNMVLSNESYSKTRGR